MNHVTDENEIEIEHVASVFIWSTLDVKRVTIAEAELGAGTWRISMVGLNWWETEISLKKLISSQR